MPLNILAYGVNGAQMNAGTQALIDAGHNVRAFTRSPDSAEHWKTLGADIVTGDMADVDVLRRASEGQDALFLHVPLIIDPNDDRSAYGLNALKAAKEAGINRVIWNTGGPIMDPSSKTDASAILLRTLQDEGFSFLGLTPITYMENLLGSWTIDGLTQDKLFYPTPAQFKMQWGAAADFGRVADKALQGELPNEVIAVGGPAALDGDELANIIAQVLGRNLSFETMEVGEFQRQLSEVAGPQVGGMIAGMYGGIQANPEQFEPSFIIDADAIESRFDIKLTTLADWVSKHKILFA